MKMEDAVNIYMRDIVDNPEIETSKMFDHESAKEWIQNKMMQNPEKKNEFNPLDDPDTIAVKVEIKRTPSEIELYDDDTILQMGEMGMIQEIRLLAYNEDHPETIYGYLVASINEDTSEGKWVDATQFYYDWVFGHDNHTTITKEEAIELTNKLKEFHTWMNKHIQEQAIDSIAHREYKAVEE